MIPILLLSRDGELLPDPYTADGSTVTIEDNDGNVSIEVTNPTGGSLDFVVARTTVLPDGDTAGPKTLTVGAGVTKWYGPWPPAVFNDSSNRVGITPDAGLELRGLRW